MPQRGFGGSALPLHRQRAPALHLLPREDVTGREVPQLQLGTVSTEIYYQRLPMPDNLLQSSLLLAWSLINKGLDTVKLRIFPNSIIYRKEHYRLRTEITKCTTHTLLHSFHGTKLIIIGIFTKKPSKHSNNSKSNVEHCETWVSKEQGPKLPKAPVFQ